MIQWDADPTGKWTDMQIELKTGDNFNMVPLKGLDSFLFSRSARSQQFNSDHHDRCNQANSVCVHVPHCMSFAQHATVGLRLMSSSPRFLPTLPSISTNSAPILRL